MKLRRNSFVYEPQTPVALPGHFPTRFVGLFVATIIITSSPTMPPKRAASPAKKTTKQPTPPAQARASKRQATPSTKSVEAAAAVGSTARAKSPSKKTATNQAMPTTRAKSPAKGKKSPKKATSPEAGTSSKRGRGRPPKTQPEDEIESDLDGEDEGDVVQTIERSPSRGKSPGKGNARGKSRSPARSTIPLRSPSQSPKKLGKTPALSPKRMSSAIYPPTSPKAPQRGRVQLHDEDELMEGDLHTYGNSEIEEEVLRVNNRNIVEPLGHDFPSHPSKVTPRSGTAAAASTRASPTPKRPARPNKQAKSAYGADSEDLAGPSQRKPQQIVPDKPLEPGMPSAPGRGPVRSVTNPEYIPDANGKPTDRKNPFFETMPAPEIWHRRMPPIFPFGETKRMEEIYSDQINEDLNRSKYIGLNFQLNNCS